MALSGPPLVTHGWPTLTGWPEVPVYSRSFGGFFKRQGCLRVHDGIIFRTDILTVPQVHSCLLEIIHRISFKDEDAWKYLFPTWSCYFEGFTCTLPIWYQIYIFPSMGIVCHQHYTLIWLNMTLSNSSRGVLSRVNKQRNMWDQASLYDDAKAKLGLPLNWKSTPKKNERGGYLFIAGLVIGVNRLDLVWQ